VFVPTFRLLAIFEVLLQKLPGAYLPLEASLYCCDPEHLSKDTVLSEDMLLRTTLDLAFPIICITS
jgi:hypothetical protein